MVPPQPEAGAYMPAYPAFQAVEIAAFFGQTEVIPPAVQIGVPLVSKLVTAQTLAALPQLPYSVLESLQAARGHFDLPGRVDPKSQELALPGPPHSALGRVDFQPQLLANPLRDTGQHPHGWGRGWRRSTPAGLPPDCLRRCCSRRHTAQRPASALAVAGPVRPGRCWPAGARAARLVACRPRPPGPLLPA